MIQITNYEFEKYNLSYNINQELNTGIFCINNNILEKILLQIAGINKSKGIYYRSKKVFDNKQYFNERLYLNCNNQIVNTLVVDQIVNTLENNFNVIASNDLLKNYISQLQIRSEGKLDSSYTFTNEGNTLINNAIALSMFKYPILLNPLENIENKYKIEYLKKVYSNKPSLFGVSNLRKYNGFIDELILFGNNNVYILKSNEKLILLKNIINQDLIISECNLQNNLIHKCNKTEDLILYNNLSNDQLKHLRNLNVKINEISLFEIGDYIC